MPSGRRPSASLEPTVGNRVPADWHHGNDRCLWWRQAAARRLALRHDGGVLPCSVRHPGGLVLAVHDPLLITVGNAAAPKSSLSFLFWGAGLFVLPVIAIYTGQCTGCSAARCGRAITDRAGCHVMTGQVPVIRCGTGAGSDDRDRPGHDERHRTDERLRTERHRSPAGLDPAVREPTVLHSWPA